jgi:8-oxo-dGTP pyrophosphatase MutT (NUDIX family)
MGRLDLSRLSFALSRAGFSAYLRLKALATPVAFGACAVLDDARGRVLLVRHSYRPGWHLPGGGVGAGEPPAAAIVRELQEEIGFVRGGAPQLTGVFTRRLGWVTNVIALYHVRDAEIAFRPNFEIREIVYADPAALPPGTTASTRRRLAEHLGKAPPSPYW